MKIELTNTTKLITLRINGADVPARIWEGITDSGIPVHAYITRIAVPNEADHSQFERELEQCAAPSADVQIPLRLIL